MEDLTSLHPDVHLSLDGFHRGATGGSALLVFQDV